MLVDTDLTGEDRLGSQFSDHVDFHIMRDVG